MITVGLILTPNVRSEFHVTELGGGKVVDSGKIAVIKKVGVLTNRFIYLHTSDV